MSIILMHRLFNYSRMQSITIESDAYICMCVGIVHCMVYTCLRI